MNEPRVTKETNEEQVISKKPYEKPQIIYRAPLEAAAGACDPIGNPGGKAGGGCTILNS